MSESRIDTREYRNTIGLFATGVTVITCHDGEQLHGMTANSVTSVSLDPLLLLFCVDRRARMAEKVTRAGRFAVNILSAEQEPISRHFAGRPDPNLQLVLYELQGVPVLADTLATLVCTIDRVLDGGDHLIVLARVDALDRPHPEQPPLLYFGGRYRQMMPERRPEQRENTDDYVNQMVLSFS